jgi:CRP-like cAMP-binding protein
MSSALVRSDVEVPQWLAEQLRQICQSSIQIALQFQKACLKQQIYRSTEVNEDAPEVLWEH